MTPQASTATPAPRFPGTPVTLAGTTYVVPPLSVGQLKRLHTEIEQMRQLPDGALSPEAVNTVVKVVHAALSRNYPEMRLEDIEDIVDVTTLLPLISATTGFRTPTVGLQS